MRNDLIYSDPPYEVWRAVNLLDKTIIGYESLYSACHEDMGVFLLNITEAFLDKPERELIWF